ncbi:MAG TPA: triphosphoribosyl-dephospho-CoA synthase [Methanocorpusculum sp.]|nr:triphosphoribosyl-dephospho-CoA synthase [Methanocorpusculum sp.]
MMSAADAAELASFAMLLEVCAKIKPGNVDREHDYDDTRLEHFLSSAVRARPVFEKIDELSLGQAMYDAVKRTNGHSGGNTHFGAFILLLPLLKGRGIDGANKAVHETTVDDAVLFYQAFGLTAVRVSEDSSMDVNNPASLEELRRKNMTMYDVMSFSAENDMVAREWTNGFALVHEFADRLKKAGGSSQITSVFMEMLATYPDTFVAKKLGQAAAEELRNSARMVQTSRMSIEVLDAWCLTEGINPGSLADICIAGIFIALMEGWNWDS